MIKKYVLLIIFLITVHVKAQTFMGNVGPINDLSENNFSLNISGLVPAAIDTTLFGLENICLNLTHTYNSDLKIQLIAPDGTTVLLCNGIGGGDDNFTNTCFNESATTPIINGTAPFTGDFTPQGDMGVVNNGQNPNGNWVLRITDNAGADIGDLLSWSLTFGNNPAQYYSFSSSNMPVVIINTNNQEIVQTGKITANMGIIYNGTGVRNYVTDSLNNYNGYIGIEIRGNFSSSLPQLPYDIETRDSLGNNLNVSLLGMPQENDWALIAMYNDKSFFRNMLAYKSSVSMGNWAPRSVLCEVILNGQYQGVYALSEKIKRDNNRVNIARLDSNEITWPDVSGGYILKTDYWDDNNSWQTQFTPPNHPDVNVHLVYQYPQADALAIEQKNYIQDFVNQFETALYGAQFADSINGYRKFISTKSFIDYFIVNELARNVDGFKKSCYYHKEKDNINGSIGKLKAGPVWDFDWAWKDIWDCSIFQANDGSGWSHLINDCGPDIYGTGWHTRLLEDPNFANELNCRWTSLRTTILDTSYLFNWIDSMAVYSFEAQERHYSLWGNMGVATGTPEVGNPAESYLQEISFFKAWIRRRINWLDANMPGNSNNCDILTNVSASKNAQETLSVFPNPFVNTIEIFVNENYGRAQLEIINAQGITVIEKEAIFEKYKSTKLVINSSLPSGFYTMRVKGEQINVSKKLIHLQ
jgi:subtilisin-like proprotein convertase family protein